VVSLGAKEEKKKVVLRSFFREKTFIG